MLLHCGQLSFVGFSILWEEREGMGKDFPHSGHGFDMPASFREA